MFYSKDEVNSFMGEVKRIIDGPGERDGKLQRICAMLKENVSYYDWVGFYFANTKQKELVLGPFIGEPTEHTRISFGEGICGQAAITKKPFIVQDVRRETNYLSCNVKVMSEIVVPIMKNGDVLGELDIDSHTLSPFTDKDVYLLESVCKQVASML